MDKFYNDITFDEIINKEKALSNFVKGMINKTNNIFQYTGLPKTIPPRFLELYLQMGGQCFITKYNDKLYAFQGGLGGEPDEYYQPTIYTVANPALKFFKNCRIGEEGILCRNDTMMLGLKPVILKYGILIVENLVSFRVAAINTRIQTIIDASDDTAYESALKYIKDIEEGKLSAISSGDLFDKIHVNPASSHDQCIIQLIELNQYLLSQLYAEIGIADNYNMKRERLTEVEADMIKDKPVISLENMFEERCTFCDSINELYGTNIKVYINERWDENDDDLKGSFAGYKYGNIHHNAESSRKLGNENKSEESGYITSE